MQTAPLHTHLDRMPGGGKAFWRLCADGTRVRVAVWPGRGNRTVLVFPGRTEFIEKYGDVVRRFLDRGYSAAVIDWRGQGMADRHPKRPKMGWVREFHEYQLDVAELLGTVRDSGLPEPYALIAHSMGGCIGLRALCNDLHVEKTIFSAPMWGIYTKPNLRLPAWLVTQFGPILGFGEKFIPTGGPENSVLEHPFEGNTLTNDQSSYTVMKSHLEQCPELGLGFPSIRWLNRARSEARAVVNAAPTEHSCLTFVGTNETIVLQSAISEVMDKWANGKLVVLEHAQHELLEEEPHVLELIWNEIDAYLAQ